MTQYDENGNAVTIRGRRVGETNSRSAVEVERDSQQAAVNRPVDPDLFGRSDAEGLQSGRDFPTEPSLIDAVSGKPVRPQANPAPKDEEPDEEPDAPAHVETLGGARPPVDTRANLPSAPAPESIVSGQRYQSPRDSATSNPFSVLQASEQSSRANLARLLPNVQLPAVDLTGASARKPSPDNPRAVNPSIEDPALANLPIFKQLGIDTPQVRVADRARSLGEQLRPSFTKPQTSVRGGLGEIPTLGLPRALKTGIKPNVPESLASTPSIPSTSLERPFISREIGESIGSGLGRIGAVTSILAPLAGQGTAAQKETAVGKGAGLFAGSEIASRGASILGATEDLTEGVRTIARCDCCLSWKRNRRSKSICNWSARCTVIRSKVIR